MLTMSPDWVLGSGERGPDVLPHSETTNTYASCDVLSHVVKDEEVEPGEIVNVTSDVNPLHQDCCLVCQQLKARKSKYNQNDARFHNSFVCLKNNPKSVYTENLCNPKGKEIRHVSQQSLACRSPLQIYKNVKKQGTINRLETTPLVHLSASSLTSIESFRRIKVSGKCFPCLPGNQGNILLEPQKYPEHLILRSKKHLPSDNRLLALPLLKLPQEVQQPKYSTQFNKLLLKHEHILVNNHYLRVRKNEIIHPFEGKKSSPKIETQIDHKKINSRGLENKNRNTQNQVEAFSEAPKDKCNAGQKGEGIMNMDGIEVVREIGRGTYGTVWLVQKRSDQKYLVLKSMDLTNSSQHEAEAARQEVCLLASLRHPNIVSYKGSFELRRQLHLLMGYCEGGDLFTRIKEQQGKLFPEQCIMRWFIQITMALQYLHSHNVLHRDLKTQNIFLTRTGLIKLGDFGIARILGSSIDMATTMIGTPYYMSPELFAGLPYNYKSDVWALGCCLYELVSLKHAFHARDLSGLIFKVSQGKVGAIPKLYSDDLQSLITDMLNRTSDLRPSASQILHRPFVKSHISSFLKDTKQPGKHMQQTSEVQGEKFTKINVSQESKSVKDHIQDEKLTCDIKKEEIVAPKQSAKRVEICPEFVSLQISDDKIKMKNRPKVESKTNGIKECDCLQQEYEEEPAAGQGSKSRRRRHCNKNSNLVSSVSSQEKMLSSDTSDPPTCKVALPTSNYSARERRRQKKNVGVLEPLSKETADNVEKDKDSNVDNPAGQLLLPSKIQEVNDFVNILNRTLSDTGEENQLKPSVQGNPGVIPKTGHLSRVSILEDILISEVGKIKATEALDLLKSDSWESWEAQRASIQRMLGEEVFSSVGNIIWQLKLWYSVHHDELDIT